MSWGVQDLEVRYGHHRAVAGVTFEAPPRTVTALVGGDGAGKTSVLRALVGAHRPATGTVDAPEARRVGYVSTGPGIWRDRPVAENLGFPAPAYGVGRAGRERAAALLERTGLAAARDRL